MFSFTCYKRFQIQKREQRKYRERSEDPRRWSSTYLPSGVDPLLSGNAWYTLRGVVVRGTDYLLVILSYFQQISIDFDEILQCEREVYFQSLTLNMGQCIVIATLLYIEQLPVILVISNKFQSITFNTDIYIQLQFCTKHTFQSTQPIPTRIYI